MLTVISTLGYKGAGRGRQLDGEFIDYLYILFIYILFTYMSVNVKSYLLRIKIYLHDIAIEGKNNFLIFFLFAIINTKIYIYKM